jgi:hypothetical protein
VQQKDTQLKRLIKTRIKIDPYKVYQLEDSYVAELDDQEVFRTKHQHLCTSFCQIRLAEQRKLKNESIVNSLNLLKASGII